MPSCQAFALTGAVIVPLPQAVSQADARRGLEGFRQMEVPSLGVIEKTHIAVVDAVANGRVEIGATFQNVHPKTGEVTTAGWTESSGSRVRPVEVVAVAGEIPTDGFVVSKKVDAATRLSIARWFLTPDESAKTLLQDLVGASEFRIPSESHFEPLRELLRVARVRGFAIEAPGRLV